MEYPLTMLFRMFRPLAMVAVAAITIQPFTAVFVQSAPLTSRAEYYVEMKKTTIPHAIRPHLAHFSNPQQSAYIANVTIGGVDYPLLLDTGSSDTWIPEKNFKCLFQKGTHASHDICKFPGPFFDGNFTNGRVRNVNFNATYGSGFVEGNFGFDDVSIAGLSVRNVQVAAATAGFIPAEKLFNGILGLTFPALTSEHAGSDPLKDSATTKNIYQPFIFKMFQQGLASPSFAVAPQRNGSAGFLAFGGLPPVQTVGKTAVADIHLSIPRIGAPTFAFYNISVDAITFNGQHSRPFFAIVDTGTTLTLAPPDTVNSIARSFNPPLKFNNATGFFDVACNATTPRVAVVIDKVEFTIRPEELIHEDTPGSCILGIQKNNGGPSILGDTFLTNLVTVFDLGKNHVQFTQQKI